MSLNKLYIELGSLSTQVMKCSGNEGLKVLPAILHPSGVVTPNGEFNIDVYTEKVFKRIQNYVEEHNNGGQTIKAFATGIYRNAENKDEVLQLLNIIKNIELTVLSIEEESQLSFDSYLENSKQEIPEKVIYIDIGGGSTEIAVFENAVLQSCISIQLGVIILVAQLFEHNVSLDEGFQEIEKKITTKLEQHSEFLDILKNIINEHDCSIVVTGMVVKKIPRRYLKNGNVSIISLRQFLTDVYNKLDYYNNTFHLKRMYGIKKDWKTIDNTNLYLGGFFLYFILDKIGVESISINTKGLKHSFVDC